MTRCGVGLVPAYLDGPNRLKQCEVVIFDQLTNVEGCRVLVGLACLFMRSNKGRHVKEPHTTDQTLNRRETHHYKLL